ncbi:MAG TPA: DUF2844 domain-containing protein [Steroidobacteraceae bacterium]
MRATLYSLALACLLFQGLPQPARAALGGTADTVESDRLSMKALTRPVPTGALRKEELQLPSGTVVTEYLGSTGLVYAVTWHGPSLPNLQLILGNYFANLKTAARQPVVRRRLVRVNSPDIVIESGGKTRAFAGRAWLPTMLPPGVTAADIQ